MDYVRVLFLENGEVLLRVPVPDAVTGKDKVHLLERALVGLWVERPDYDDRQNIDATEDVERLLIQSFEDRREKQGLAVVSCCCLQLPCDVYGCYLHTTRYQSTNQQHPKHYPGRGFGVGKSPPGIAMGLSAMLHRIWPCRGT